MSTVKISELTALTSADAADELVIVDDSAGVTKKITHANLANFGTRTVTAGAIDFSGNANAAGMTSELLDDYEEGTFTPVIFGSSTTGVGTYSIQTGRYVKIGGIVHASMYLVWTAHTGTGSGFIGGLPFTAINDADTYFGGAVSQIGDWSLGTNNIVGAYVPFNTARMSLVVFEHTTPTPALLPIDSAAQIMVSVSYRAS